MRELVALVDTTRVKAVEKVYTTKPETATQEQIITVQAKTNDTYVAIQAATKVTHNSDYTIDRLLINNANVLSVPPPEVIRWSQSEITGETVSLPILLVVIYKASQDGTLEFKFPTPVSGAKNYGVVVKLNPNVEFTVVGKNAFVSAGNSNPPEPSTDHTIPGVTYGGLRRVRFCCWFTVGSGDVPAWKSQSYVVPSQMERIVELGISQHSALLVATELIEDATDIGSRTATWVASSLFTGCSFMFKLPEFSPTVMSTEYTTTSGRILLNLAAEVDAGGSIPAEMANGEGGIISPGRVYIDWLSKLANSESVPDFDKFSESEVVISPIADTLRKYFT